MDLCANDKSARRSATLTGLEKCAVQSAIHCRFKIGIVEYDQRVFTAHFQLQLYQSGRGLCGDPASRKDRAREGQRIDAAYHRGTELRPRAHDEIEHTLR